jgi:hypothetical protein
MPIDYKKYPPNWFSEIRPAILLRAKNACEFCGVENYSPILKKEKLHGVVVGVKEARVILTIAHLNHDITNNEPWNLRALCQRCHLKHDQTHHQESRKRTKRKQHCERIAASGQLELLEITSDHQNDPTTALD